MGNKQRLFEIMGNVNPDFKKKKILNESDEHERYSEYNRDVDSRLQKYAEEHEPDTSWTEIKDYFKKEADKFNMKLPIDALDKYFELVNDFLEKKENTDKSLNESDINPKYTHFAALKDGNKIVNGWDYNGYDPEELKMGKKEYFFDDIIDMDINPKKIAIYTTKTLQRKGIDPFDTNNWYKFEAEGWRDKNDLN